MAASGFEIRDRLIVKTAITLYVAPILAVRVKAIFCLDVWASLRPKCFLQKPANAGRKPDEKQPLAARCNLLFSIRNLLTRASDKRNFRVNATRKQKESWLHPDSSNPISNTV
ncbi:MAG: hypothetical protein IPQ17_07230 [Xanthomonadales bacterium]|nr:hypothetical protein [Xanthomonadales bacterium]